MTSAQVVETSVTNNSSSQNYSHPDDHTIRTTDTPGFKPVTMHAQPIESASSRDREDSEAVSHMARKTTSFYFLF